MRKAKLHTQLTIDDLRAIQDRNPDPDVRLLLWEIKRLHNALRQADELRVSIEDAWRQEVGGTLVAIWSLRLLLANELMFVHLPEPGAKREPDL